MSKGSKRRPGNDEAYRSNWERIFENSKIRRCNFCHEEVGGVGGGDEWLDYCHQCDMIVEGETYDD